MRRTALFLLLFLTVGVPLAFFVPASHMFEDAKFAVASVTIILFSLTAALVPSGRQRLPLSLACFALFLLVAFLSATLGLDFSTSLLGSPDRHMGLLTWLLFFLLCASIVRLCPSALEQRRFVILPLFAVSIVEVLIACIQRVWPHLLFPYLQVNEVAGRSFGTFGHPNILAAFLLVPLLIAVAGSFEVQGRRRVASVFFSLFLLLGISLTGSRAAMLGAFAGIVSLLLIIRKDKRVWISLLVLLLSLAALTFWTMLHRGSAAVDSANIRLLIWSSVPSAFLSHPWLGAGQENIWLALKPLEAPALASRFPHTIIDRSHNVFFDILLQTGIAGFILSVGFLSALLRDALRAPLIALRAGQIAVLVAVLVAWQFGFPTVADGMMFSLLCGLLMSASKE